MNACNLIASWKLRRLPSPAVTSARDLFWKMTPEQQDRRERAALEAMTANLITVNRAREMVGEGPLRDGDRYLNEMPSMFFDPKAMS